MKHQHITMSPAKLLLFCNSSKKKQQETFRMEKYSGYMTDNKKKVVPLHPSMAIWWLMPPDAREYR